MLIEAKLINSDAELNDFFELDALEYVPGEQFDIAIRLFDRQSGLRYIPASGSTMEMKFTKNDDMVLTLTAAVVDADDRSMWKVTMSAANSLLLASSNIDVELTESAILKIARIENALSKIVFGAC